MEFARGERLFCGHDRRFGFKQLKLQSHIDCRWRRCGRLAPPLKLDGRLADSADAARAGYSKHTERCERARGSTA